MAISFSERLRVAEDVLVQDIKGETMFLNMASESYFGLDPVGSRMFRVLSAADSIQAAFTTLQQEYDVEPDRLRSDLETLIDKLLETGLMRIERDE